MYVGYHSDSLFANLLQVLKHSVMLFINRARSCAEFEAPLTASSEAPQTSQAETEYGKLDSRLLLHT